MQTRTGANESHSHTSQPFFGDRSASSNAFFAPMIQAKCAECEKEEMVQRKCATCEDEKQVSPQLEIGAVDDPLEVEADTMADRVVRRQVARVEEREREPMPLQAKAKDTASSESSDSPESTSSGLETAIADASGSGSALAPNTRDQMEDAFDADFSSVRVHTGTQSAVMNEEIGARAFTYGNDIHFNDGEYTPGTEQGTRLLAHELTHVVQQNRSVQRAPKRIRAKVQLGPLVFGPASGMPKGNLIHNEGLLPSFKEAGLNEGLWVEQWTPGANRLTTGRGLHGIPDFYRDNAIDGRPIGINQGALGGFDRIGKAVAAPQPPLTPGGPMEDMAHAPKDIELGDVKPGQSGEEHVGRDQIANYSAGIKNTAKAVNAYQTAHNHTEQWNPSPGPMGHLEVPPRLATSHTGGVRYAPLSVWEWLGKWNLWTHTSMKGSCIVYKSSVSGIWAYEWMPDSVPDTVGDDAGLKKLLDRLETEVKPKLHSPKKPAGKRKAARKRLRRKAKPHEKFDDKAWQNAYKPWHDDAEKQLGDPKTKENVGVLDALTDGKKRTHFDPGIPQPVKERAKGVATIRHWARWGKLYGWLRKTFDSVYVKLAAFANWIKEKVKNLTKSAGSSGFGNWIKAAALALYKVAKKLGAWTVSMVVDKLLDSLQEGISNIIKQLYEAYTPDAVKSKIEEAEALKAGFEQWVAEAQESLEKKIFGDKIDLFTKLEKYMKIASDIGTIVSVVKWAIRLVACASPPLLGCLWNLAMAALEWAFSKIMQTCWFSSKVLGWIRDSGVQEILDFPTTVAQFVVGKINPLIPLPDGIGPLFAKIEIDHKEFNINCKGGGGGGDGEGGEEGGGDGGGPEPSEEQKALMDLAKEVGDKKMEAFLKMAAKRAADYNVALDAERIRKLSAMLKLVSEDQLEALAENQPVDGIPVPIEEFLKSIGTLTESEKARKSDRKIDYDKAKKNNPKYEKSLINWKPETFVKSGVKSDSAEFADAIYDIQKILGIKADGMAGPGTTKTFYERNNQPKDDAYRNAVEAVEDEKRAQEERKATEARKKEVKALLDDPKVKAALAEPFPSEDQLKTDLTSLHWENLDDGGAAFVKKGGRAIIAIKTDAAHRLGAYFHFVEREDKGVKKTLMLDTSRFYALDAVDKNEMITFSIVDNEGNKGLWYLALLGQKKESFSAATLRFFSLSIQFE